MLVTVASKGRKPPSCWATSTPLTKTRARWVTEPNRRTMSQPLHSAGTKKLVSYQKSPQYSREALSVNRSQKEAGTGMEREEGSSSAHPASTPLLSGSKLKRHIPSRPMRRRVVVARGYSKERFIRRTSHSSARRHFACHRGVYCLYTQYDRNFIKGIERFLNKSRLFSGKQALLWAEYLLSPAGFKNFRKGCHKK